MGTNLGMTVWRGLLGIENNGLGSLKAEDSTRLRCADVWGFQAALSRVALGSLKRVFWFFRLPLLNRMAQGVPNALAD